MPTEKELLQQMSAALRAAADDKSRTRLEADRNYIVSQVGKDLADVLKPVIIELGKTNKLTQAQIYEAVANAISDVRVQVDTPAPVVNVAPAEIPEIRVPTPVVNYTPPSVIVPPLKMPDEMNVRGWVQLQGVSLENPLPVQLRNADGSPMRLFENLTTLVGGGSGGGKTDHFTVKGFGQSAFAELTNPDGRVRVELPTGSSGLTDTELRASSVPVAQASDATWSVAVKEIFGSTITTLLNGDNRIPVSVETGGSGLTDAELRASGVPVAQVSGASWSVEATISGTPTVTATDLDIRDLTQASDSVRAYQVSGSSWSVEATISGTPTVTATDLDIRDLTNSSDSVRAYQLSGASWSVEATQSGTWNIGTVTTLTGVTNSIAAALVNSTGVQYSGSNPVPTYLVASTGNSTISVGPVLHDAADDGAAPQKIGGTAMTTTNPTAVAAGDIVRAIFDKLGRQVVRPFHVRELTLTAYATITTGIETTLLSGSAGSYHDLVYIMAANESNAAQNIDIRAVTAGNVMLSLSIPANGTAGVALPMPIPQDATGNNWTIDNDGTDVSNTTINVSALFVREV